MDKQSQQPRRSRGLFSALTFAAALSMAHTAVANASTTHKTRSTFAGKNAGAIGFFQASDNFNNLPLKRRNGKWRVKR